MSLVTVVCFQVEAFTSVRSLAQGCPIDCGVSECDRIPSIIKNPWPSRGCCALDKEIKYLTPWNF
jgi:hypothetical protein